MASLKKQELKAKAYDSVSRIEHYSSLIKQEQKVINAVNVELNRINEEEKEEQKLQQKK